MNINLTEEAKSEEISTREWLRKNTPWRHGPSPEQREREQDKLVWANILGRVAVYIIKAILKFEPVQKKNGVYWNKMAGFMGDRQEFRQKYPLGLKRFVKLTEELF
jgi:hypothetical protein